MDNADAAGGISLFAGAARQTAQQQQQQHEPLLPQVRTNDPFEEANVIRKALRIKVCVSVCLCTDPCTPPPPMLSSEFFRQQCTGRSAHCYMAGRVHLVLLLVSVIPCELACLVLPHASTARNRDSTWLNSTHGHAAAVVQFCCAHTSR